MGKDLIINPSMLSVEMCEAESWFTRSWLNRLVFCFINKAKDLAGVASIPKDVRNVIHL